MEPIEWLVAELVEWGGRPGHEGHFATDRSPVVGERALARLVLTGSVASAEPRCVDLAGDPIDAAPCEVLRRDGSEWLVEFTVPDRPFRWQVRGEDATGAPFARVFGGAFQPSFGREPESCESARLV